MSSAANVLVQMGPHKGDGVYLYTHWGGARLPETVRQALARADSLSDDQYLARVVFCTMIKGHEDEQAGFGLCIRAGHSRFPLIEVHCRDQVVRFRQTWVHPERGFQIHWGEPMAEHSFKDYIAKPFATYPLVYLWATSRPPSDNDG